MIIVELFSGGGMARLGIERYSRPVVAWANDFDVKKASYYEKRFNHKVDTRDICDITQAPVQDVNLVWASWPCTDFSSAGGRNGFKGKTKPVYDAMVRLIKQDLKPKMVIYENAPRLLQRFYLEKLIGDLKDQYDYFYAFHIDAAYFVPQSRKRTIFVASSYKLDQGTFWNYSGPGNGGYAVSHMYYEDDRSNLKFLCYRNTNLPIRKIMLEDIMEKKAPWFSVEKSREILSCMSPLGKKKYEQALIDQCEKYGTAYRRTRSNGVFVEPRFDGLAGCLKASTGGSSRQYVISLKGRDMVRMMTPREGARLMGLPDDYELPESQTDAWKLIGDGVVVPVAEYVYRFYGAYAV